jgi:23S rRNA (cytidine1920-2'-O)/16S rRNA (cytidine1409-2'-O)-methyltransferase
MTSRRRLDAELVERGLAENRSRAQALVMAGRVTVGGRMVDKAGAPVAGDADIAVTEGPRYVSRGGDKLETGLRRWHVEVTGERCLDVGASTGGFTDCLLQHGAAEVIALDVGRGQLHERLRSNSSVHVIERMNARALTAADLPYRPGFMTADVSFISLRLVLPPVVARAGEATVRSRAGAGQGRRGARPGGARAGVARSLRVRDRIGLRHPGRVRFFPPGAGGQPRVPPVPRLARPSGEPGARGRCRRGDPRCCPQPRLAGP